LRFLDGVDDELKPDEKELNGRSNAKKIRLKVCRVPKRLKDEYTNICPSCFSLLRTEYRTKTLELRELPRMFRFYRVSLRKPRSRAGMRAGGSSKHLYEKLLRVVMEGR